MTQQRSPIPQPVRAAEWRMIDTMTDSPEKPPTTDGPVDMESTGAVLPVVIVTGMSGAGRSTALKALEDLGY